MKNFFLFVFFSFFIELNAQITDIVTGLPSPNPIVFKDNILYVGDTVANKIYKIDVTSSVPVAQDVISGLNNPISLVFNGNDLYIAEFGSNKISKIDVTDSNPIIQDVITGLSTGPTGLAISGNSLYISFRYQNKISKIDITAANPILNTVHYNSIHAPIALAINGNDLYFSTTSANVNTVKKIDITQDYPTASIFMSGSGVTFHIIIHEGYLYMSELFIGKFGLVNGGGIALLMYEGLPNGLAVYDNYLYVAQIVNNRIYKYDVSLILSTNDVIPIGEKSVLYPNPASDYIKVSKLTRTENFKIYDMLGIEVLNGSIALNGQIEIKSLNKGMYFIHFDDRSTMKFIKK